MFPLSEWQTFSAVQAGAAATLTGLVFVAVSINLARILGSPGLPGRAAESICQFLQVFFISTAVLIPRQSVAALAVELLVITLLSWGIQITTHVAYAKSRADTLFSGWSSGLCRPSSAAFLSWSLVFCYC